ncbi:MAG: hypothetical protein LBI05_07915 [Planctomycetaceae bacterium]|nr:hypothetical protein [Planctomycetaceae bacterium]
MNKSRNGAQLKRKNRFHARKQVIFNKRKIRLHRKLHCPISALRPLFPVNSDRVRRHSEPPGNVTCSAGTDGSHGVRLGYFSYATTL